MCAPLADYLEKMSRGQIEAEDGELSKTVRDQIWKVAVEAAQGEARLQLSQEIGKQEQDRAAKHVA